MLLGVSGLQNDRLAVPPSSACTTADSYDPAGFGIAPFPVSSAVHSGPGQRSLEGRPGTSLVFHVCQLQLLKASSGVATTIRACLLCPGFPSSAGRRGRPFRDNRRVVEGTICRYRCGLPGGMCWPSSVRGRRFGKGTAATAVTETWDRILAALLTVADPRGEVDWSTSVDSTVNRPPARHQPSPHHRGPVELHESVC